MLRFSLATVGALALLFLGCSTPSAGGYRMADATPLPESAQAELFRKYPAFLGVVFDSVRIKDPDTRAVRDDLEREPVGTHSFDALHAVALAYFELNALAEQDRGGDHYLAHSFRAAKVLAIPWRAYGEISDDELRDAILHFFEDAAFGGKPGTRETAPRLARVVESLAKKETDPARSARIESLVRRIEAEAPPPDDGA